MAVATCSFCSKDKSIAVFAVKPSAGQATTRRELARDLMAWAGAAAPRQNHRQDTSSVAGPQVIRLADLGRLQGTNDDEPQNPHPAQPLKNPVSY